MIFPAQILNLLPWLIFIQGTLLSLVVLSRKQYKSNIYLGVFLVLLSIHGLATLLWIVPDNWIFPEIYVGLGAFPFFYGPLIYRYVWHSLYRDVGDGIPFAVHSIPGILDFLFYLSVYLIKGRTSFLQTARLVMDGSGPLYVSVIEWVKILFGLFYCILIIRLLAVHRKSFKNLASREKHKRWLNALLAVFSLNWLVVLASGLVLWTGQFAEGLNMLLTGLQLIAFLALMYTLVFFAVKFPVILEPREVREAIRKKLNLPDGFIDETLHRLQKAEKQAFFNDPEVTLTSLASSLGLHPNALSFIINETQGMSFRQYLNHLRLVDFLDRVQKDRSGRSFLTHALDAGFASKSTYLRTFRMEFSCSPREYLAGGGINSHTEGSNTHTETS